LRTKVAERMARNRFRSKLRAEDRARSALKTA